MQNTNLDKKEQKNSNQQETTGCFFTAENEKVIDAFVKVMKKNFIEPCSEFYTTLNKVPEFCKRYSYPCPDVDRCWKEWLKKELNELQGYTDLTDLLTKTKKL